MMTAHLYRLLLPFIVAFGWFLLPVAASAADEVYPGTAWDEPPQAATGWAAEKLKVADEIARSIGTDAYLVVHRGTVVHKFGEVDKPMNLASVRKSVLSILYGIEVDRNHIDLNKTLAELGVDDRGGLSEREKTATVRQLLEARSGIYHPAAYETAGMKADRPYRGSQMPGTRWYYNNWDFNALGTIFEKLTGNDVFSALDKELAGPLGFQDFSRSRDTEYVPELASAHPAYLMHLSARDLARVGLLMARGGRWQDRQIVSTKWVTESTSLRSFVSPALGYGYMWWVGAERWAFGQRFPGAVFSARGNYGQFVLVDPSRDLVVVHRVDISRFLKRQVSNAQFGTLIASVLLAAPNGF